MKVKYIKQKLFLSALAGAIVVPRSGVTVRAADNFPGSSPLIPVAEIQSAVQECYESKMKNNLDLYLVKNNEGKHFNMAFSKVKDFTYIRNAPNMTSDWVGKLYSNSAAEVLEYVGGWTKIRSGLAEGYVSAESLYTGKDAESHAGEYEQQKAIVTADVLNVRDGQGTHAQILTRVLEGQQYEVTGSPVSGWYPIDVNDTDGWVSGDYIDVQEQFIYGETKEEEANRIAAQEAAEKEVQSRKQQEAQQAAVVQAQRSTGQSVIDYACQFIGNPYVWGGTSLTNGADCSGFVQSVYAQFGVGLPRTTWDMEKVGTPVTYDQALPGDIVLYDGHVGLYMGDGTIVNAMNEADGIGICSATYAPIIAVRRVL